MKYFTIKELCRSNTAAQRGISNVPTPKVEKRLAALVDNVLDPLREWYGKPIPISSGYRNYTLNKAVGGVATSQHMKGEAVDIDLGKVENGKLFDYIKDNLPFDQLLWEHGGSWIHVSYCMEGNRKMVRNIK